MMAATDSIAAKRRHDMTFQQVIYRAAVTAIAAAALTAAPALADAGHHGTARSSCKHLRGTDRAPDPGVKLVRQRNADGGTDLVGCKLPRGRLRTLATSTSNANGGDGYTIAQVAGPFVLLGTSSDSQYGYSRGFQVVDIRTGRGYPIATDCGRLGGESCSSRPNETALAAFVNDHGQAVAAIVPSGSQTTTIAGFSKEGQRQDLDSGPSADLPPASLALSGTTATWTHAGEPRSATLAG
jgi:hypothetical protein